MFSFNIGSCVTKLTLLGSECLAQVEKGTKLVLIFLRCSEKTNPSSVIRAEGCWSGRGSWLCSQSRCCYGGGACKPKSPQVPLWGRAQWLCKRREYTSNAEKPASLSPPLAATTSASQAHSSLNLLALFPASFSFPPLVLLPPAVVICLHLRLCLYVWLWRKCSCYSAHPLATLTVFAWIWESIQCVKWVNDLLFFYCSICLSNLGISL